MANKNIRGITIEIGGDTTKLGKALESTEKKSKALQSELREIEKALKFDPSNVELLAQKQTVLTQNIEETANKLDTLKEAERQVIAQFERGEVAEEQVRALQREIITVEGVLDSMNRKLEDTNSELSNLGRDTSSIDKLNDAISDQEKELSELRDEYANVVLEQGNSSDEAKELASKMTALNDELGQNKKKLNDAREEANKLADSLEDVGESSENSSGGFTIMKGALADLVANAIQSAVSAIGDFIGSLFELSEATEEYRTMQAKLEGSANSFGYSIDFAKEKYKELYSYVGDDQMATNGITNLMGLGTSTESVSKLVEGAIGVWASYGDSIPIESLTESINETIAVGKVTGTFADTINWAKTSNEELGKALANNKEAQGAYNKAIEEGLPVEDAFNEALAKITDEQERADVVAQFLNSTYGESKKTYDELTGGITEANEAELELKETQAELGETMEPVNTAITDMKNKALEALLPVVQDVVKAVMDLVTWLKENPAIMQLITTIVIALATAFGVLAGALAIQGLIAGVTKAIALLNTTLLANPIVLIISAIAGLVAGFIYLWNNCEEFRNFWLGLWENIKIAFQAFIDWISPAIESIKNFFVSLWEKISEVWASIMNSLQPLFEAIVGAFKEGWELIKVVWDLVEPYFSAIWEGIKVVFSVVKEILGAYFSNAWEGIKLVWSVAVSYFQTLWNNIKLVFSVVKTFFSGMFSSAWEAIKAIWNAVTGYFTAIWNTIKGIFSVVKAVLTGNWKDAWNGIKGIVSTWTSYFSGVWTSIKKVFSSVKTWFKDTFSSAWTAIKGVFSNWGSFFSGLWDKIKNTFSKMGTNIANAIGNSVKAGINGVISAIENTINSGIKLINGAIGLINLLPGVSVGTIGTVSFPRLYRGGVLKKGQVGLLEGDGAEAVVPLEQETGWINRIAQKMNELQDVNPGLDTVALSAKMDEMIQTMKNLKSTIVLDSGVLVGETINQIDTQLGHTYSMRERRI